METRFLFNGNEVSISSLYIRTLRTYKNVKERGRANPVPTFRKIGLQKFLVLYSAPAILRKESEFWKKRKSVKF